MGKQDQGVKVSLTDAQTSPKLRGMWNACGKSFGAAAALAGLILQSGCATGGAKTPAGPTVAKEAWNEGGYVGQRLVSTNFELFTTLDDAEFVAALPGVLEAAHAAFAGAMPAGDETRQLTTYLFKSRSEWAEFVHARWPGRSDTVTRIHLGGYTEGDTSAAFFSDRATALATLVHEAWHQYVSARSEGMPTWLHEGMACYFEAVQWEGDKPQFGGKRNTFRLNSLREALAEGRWRSLEELLDTQVAGLLSTGDSCATHEYYAQVWALAVYLKHGDGGRHAGRLEQMLADIAAGRAASKVSAWRVTSGAAVELDGGAAMFLTYFGDKFGAIDAALNGFARELCGV